MRHERHYTIDEARAQLPWVAERLEELRAARDRLTDPSAREALAAASRSNGGGTPGRQVAEAFLALQATLGLVEERGIVLRDVDRGLIDFPALRDGREVYLCWLDGEDDIEYWHELDAGYAGRQEL